MICGEIENFNFYDISVLNQIWKSGSSFSYEKKRRPCFGMCYIISGSIKYVTKEKVFTAFPGDAVILKSDMHYRAVFEKLTQDILINFFCIGVNNENSFFESTDEEIIIFKGRRDLKNKFLEILEYDFINNRRCRVKAALYGIFDEIINGDLNNTLSAAIKRAIDSDGGLNMKEHELAEKCSISVSTLQRIFKKSYGKTVSEYKNELRITKAKKLLVGGLYTIEETAEILGFCDSAYFSKCFKRAEGVSPREYIKQYYTM